MERKLGIAALGLGLCFLVFVSNVPPTKAQDIDLPKLLKTMNLTTKAMFVADFLYNHKDIFQQLEDTLLAAFPILELDIKPELFTNLVLPWALDSLPYLLKNDEFLEIMKVFITEINHDYDPRFVKKTGHTKYDRNMLMMKLLSVMDYGGMIAEVLAYKSARDIVPYQSTDRPLNEQCYNDTMAFIDRLLVGEKWALNMFDAVGKPTTGIMKGVMYFLGTYDQCQAIDAFVPYNTTMGKYKAEADMTFKGRYCRATFTPPRSLVAGIAGDHINQTYGMPLTLSLGMCLPDSCHQDDIEGLLNLGILGSLFNLSVTEATCTEDQGFESDTNSHVVMGIIVGLVVLVLLSSTIDLICFQKKSNHLPGELYALSEMPTYENNAYDDIPVQNGGTDITHAHLNGDSPRNGNIPADKQNGNVTDIGKKPFDPKLNMSVDSDLTEHNESGAENVGVKLLRSFSVFVNAPNLISTETKDGDIPCLYGIRFTSMVWIILGNTYLYTVLSVAEVPVAVNLMDSYEVMKRFTFQVVLSASLATDTFFLISGCLIAYWYMSRAEDKGDKLNIRVWLKFYAGKYWKMTPPYMLVMVTFVYLYMYLGDGPVWPDRLEVADSCRTDWWKHLLYVNNIVGVDGVWAENQCMAWSWYLAVNMQFYLISPILLSFLAFSSSMGLALISIVGMAGIISAGVKESEYGGDLLTSRTDGGAYWNNVFIAPWCRVSAYCVGLMLGFILQRWNHKKMNKLIAALLWVLSLCIGIVIVYITYTKYVPELEPWTTAKQSAYEALSRPVWALCVAWLVYACQSNFGGPLGDMLSWKGFVPLSRLTFMVFLIHPVILVFITYTRRSLVYISDFDMAYLFVGHVTVNYAAAFLFSLVIDLPFRNFRRIVQGKPLDTPL